MKSVDLKELGPFQLVIVTLTLFVLGLLAAELVFELPRETLRVVRWIDNLACVFFFADFVARFVRADSKLRFMKWGWIDLLACVPVIDALRWGRLFRVVRLFRLLRAVHSVRQFLGLLFRSRTQGGMASIFVITFLVLALSTTGILVAEHDDQANIRTAEDAVWWSITTITTVGYGDRYPVTTAGRCIAAVLMFTGVGLFGTLSGVIAGAFLGDNKHAPSDPEPPSADTRALLARIDALQTELRALREPPPPGPAPGA